MTFQDVTFLTGISGSAFAPGSLDPEDIDLLRPGLLYISSEGDADADPLIDPFVNRFNPNGKLTRELPIPDKFLPDPQENTGFRDNLAFESLISTPDRHFLYTATESALLQGGPIASLTGSSPARVFDSSIHPS